MNVYEIVTLSCPLLSTAQVSEAAVAFLNESGGEGEVLGCWRSEIGVLGRVLILRRFEAAAVMMRERARLATSGNPFNAGNLVSDIDVTSYAPFPFLPPAAVRGRGTVYEFRTYELKPRGLPPTLAAWEKAVGPAGDYTAHLVIAMHALDGAPRITHIWAFDDIAQRFALRAKVYREGLWPPRGAPDQILEATSTIAVPELDWM